MDVISKSLTQIFESPLRFGEGARFLHPFRGD